MGYSGELSMGGPSDQRHLPHLTIRKASVGAMANNVYLLTCVTTDGQLLIDAADSPSQILSLIREGTGSLATRIDYLGSRGAGFHNDVRGHWSRCLFWLLALDVNQVDFVMPHAGVQLALAPGDLIVFDQTLAHGLCRAGDGGLVLEASFPAGEAARQIFLTGELPLTDAQWAALGAPWLPVEEHEHRGALDLMVAQFDERTGAVQRVKSLRDCMKRSICYVDVGN